MTITTIMIVLFAGGCAHRQQPSVLRVAMPYSDNVLDPENNYYVNWLEEKTGLDIEPVTVRQKDAVEYLDMLFASDSDIDIVMFGENLEITEAELIKYAGSGDIYVNRDGSFYYPCYGRDPIGDCGQILWINSVWLNELNLSIPETTEDLKNVLAAFKTEDPNHNGLNDEIPLLGSSGAYAFDPVEYLLNCFVTNDPYHNRRYITPDGEIRTIFEDAGFTDGIVYINSLYKENLLDRRTFTYTPSSLCEVVNSNADIVGAFTTDSISNVIYQSNPEIMAKFIHVAPLKGPGGVRNALYVKPEGEVGAVILARSGKKENAALLLDTMMTSEASLIARYGEKGVDWEESDGIDVSIYGTASTIVTRNYIWGIPQNKHLNGIGPMNVPDEYLKGVIWNGVNSDAEYIDARARMVSAPFLFKNGLDEPYDPVAAEYMDNEIRAYVRGDKIFNKNLFTRGLVEWRRDHE